MNLLIVGINYDPELTGIAPYTTELAEYLAGEHEVTVITGFPHYPDWKRRRGISGSDKPASEIRGVTVKRVRHYIPNRPTVVRRALYELSWALGVARTIRNERADAILVVTPALLGLAAVHLTNSNPSIPVGVIVQDVMSAAATESGVANGATVAKAVGRIERWALHKSASIVTIHAGLAQTIQDYFSLSAKPIVIHNWTHISSASHAEALKTREKYGWNTEIVVLHSGNIGSKQNLEVLIEAAKLARTEETFDSPTIRFVIAGGGSQERHIRELSVGLPNVEMIGTVSAGDYPALLMAADILVINERPGMHSMSLPSKLTSYFMAHRPVVAMVESTSPTAAFIAEADAGIIRAAGSPSLLLEAIKQLSSDPAESRRLAENAYRFAQSRLTSDASLSEYRQWVSKLTG